MVVVAQFYPAHLSACVMSMPQASYIRLNLLQHGVWINWSRLVLRHVMTMTDVTEIFGQVWQKFWSVTVTYKRCFGASTIGGRFHWSIWSRALLLCPYFYPTRIILYENFSVFFFIRSTARSRKNPLPVRLWQTLVTVRMSVTRKILAMTQHYIVATEGGKDYWLTEYTGDEK